MNTTAAISVGAGHAQRSDLIGALRAAVASTRDSSRKLEWAISELAEPAQELGRVGRVGRSVCHFELASIGMLARAQQAIESESRPVLGAVLAAADNCIAKAALRRDRLHARVALLNGRLASLASAASASNSPSHSSSASSPAANHPPCSPRSPRGHALNPELDDADGSRGGGDQAALAQRRQEAERRLQAVRMRKMRAAYALERVELQVGMRQRHIRMTGHWQQHQEQSQQPPSPPPTLPQQRDQQLRDQPQQHPEYKPQLHHQRQRQHSPTASVGAAGDRDLDLDLDLDGDQDQDLNLDLDLNQEDLHLDLEDLDLDLDAVDPLHDVTGDHALGGPAAPAPPAATYRSRPGAG